MSKENNNTALKLFRRFMHVHSQNKHVLHPIGLCSSETVDKQIDDDEYS